MKRALKVFAVFGFLSVAAFGGDCFVTGTTVDRANRPVRARVIAHSPPVGWEDLIVSYESGEDGQFEVPYPCKSGKATLFVTPQFDYEKDFIPIDVPINISSKVNRRLAGVRLPSIVKGVFSVGRVVVPEYFKVRIKFVDELGNAFIPDDPGEGFWLRIKPIAGRSVRWGSINTPDRRNAATSERSKLQMLLPEGEWLLEVGFNHDKEPYFYPDRAINVKASDKTGVPEFVLKMSRKDRNVRSQH